MVIPYRRCGITYLSHYRLSLNMGPIGSPETSVRNYNYWLRNNAEEHSSQLGPSGSGEERGDKGYSSSSWSPIKF
jgi:hypothetical protein